MLNSARGVTLPILFSCPLSLLMGASVNPSPTPPPMMVRPAMCSATSGKVANKRATLVRVPVATTHGVPLGCAMRASRMARMGFLSVIGAVEALGRRSVPSRPESPTFRKSYSQGFLL